MLLRGFSFVFLFLLTSLAIAEPLPSVAGRAIICDMWQYAYETQSWGCIRIPREVSVARGTSTDEALKTLQDQITSLQDRLKKLEDDSEKIDD